MSRKIAIISWKPGIRTVDLINLVKNVDQKGLAAAKLRVDKFLKPDGITIDLRVSDEDLGKVTDELLKIGVEIDLNGS